MPRGGCQKGGGCQKAGRLCRAAGGSEKSLWIVAGPVLPEGPHALYDLPLRIQSGMGFIVGSLKRGFVEGFDLVGAICSPSSSEGLVADVFQLAVSRIVPLLFFPPISARPTLDSELAVPV